MKVRWSLTLSLTAAALLAGSLAHAEEPPADAPPPTLPPAPSARVAEPEPTSAPVPLRTEGLALGVRGGTTLLVQRQAAVYVVPTLGFEGARWIARAFGLGGALDVGLHRQGTAEAGVLELRTHLRTGIETRLFFRDAFGFRLAAGPGLVWSFRDVRAGGRGEGVHRFAPTVSTRLSFETRVSDAGIVSIGAIGGVEPRAIECLVFVAYAWMR